MNILPFFAFKHPNIIFITLLRIIPLTLKKNEI